MWKLVAVWFLLPVVKLAFAEEVHIVVPPAAPAAVAARGLTSAEEERRSEAKRQKGLAHTFVSFCDQGNLAQVERMLQNAGGAADSVVPKDAVWGELNFEGATCAHQAVRSRRGDYLKILSALQVAGHPLDTSDSHSGSGFDRVPLFEAVANNDQQAFDLLLPATTKFSGSLPRGDNMEQLACLHHKNQHMCSALNGKLGEDSTERIAAALAKRKNEALNPIRKDRNVPEFFEAKKEL